MIVISCCPDCESSNIQIGVGKGPHHGKLICGDCKRFIKWLSRQDAKRLGGRVPAETKGRSEQLGLLDSVERGATPHNHSP